jgi:hypothetical protein
MSDLDNLCQGRVNDGTRSVDSYYSGVLSRLRTWIYELIQMNKVGNAINYKTVYDKESGSLDDKYSSSRAKSVKFSYYGYLAGESRQNTQNEYTAIVKENDDLEKYKGILKKKYSTDDEKTLYNEINIMQVQLVNFYMLCVYYLLVILFIIILFVVNTTYTLVIKVGLTLLVIVFPFLREWITHFVIYIYRLFSGMKSM